MSSTIEKQFSDHSYKSSSVFNKILENGEATLEDILNDEDFLAEVTIQNENLTNYLNYERVKTMIQILLTGSEGSKEKSLMDMMK